MSALFLELMMYVYYRLTSENFVSGKCAECDVDALGSGNSVGRYNTSCPDDCLRLRFHTSGFDIGLTIDKVNNKYPGTEKSLSMGTNPGTV